MVFAEDEGEKKGRINRKPGGAPTIDLRETFFEPMSLLLAIGCIKPGAEFGKEMFKNMEFTAACLPYKTKYSLQIIE